MKHFLQLRRRRAEEMGNALDNTLMLVQMVSAGLGVAALPNWAISEFSRQGLIASKPLKRVKDDHGSKYVPRERQTLSAGFQHGKAAKVRATQMALKSFNDIYGGLNKSAFDVKRCKTKESAENKSHR